MHAWLQVACTKPQSGRPQGALLTADLHTGAASAAAGAVAACPVAAGGHSDRSMCLDCCAQQAPGSLRCACRSGACSCGSCGSLPCHSSAPTDISFASSCMAVLCMSKSAIRVFLKSACTQERCLQLLELWQPTLSQQAATLTTLCVLTAAHSRRQGH